MVVTEKEEAGQEKEKIRKKPRMKSGSVPNIKSENFQKYNRLKV